MGAASSGFHDTMTSLISEEPINTLLSEEIHKLTYEDFLMLLKDLNALSMKCLDSNGQHLVFAVKKDTDSTLFWKATVQIACVKLDAATQKVITYRLLDLSQFLKVFKTLKCQILAAEQSKSAQDLDKISISSFMQNVEDTAKNHENPNECCICFEREHELTLPCTHSYCLQCIEEWNESHDTCPICREKLESTDDSWVISEIPKAEEISNEIRENLLDLTEEDKPTLCNPS